MTLGLAADRSRLLDLPIEYFQIAEAQDAAAAAASSEKKSQSDIIQESFRLHG